MKKGEKYKLDNGLKMIVGEKFNWEISPIYFDKDYPFAYNIHIGDFGESFSANYYHEEKKLKISRFYPSSDTVLVFQCDTMDDAENIVSSFAEGMNTEVYPIHLKNK